MRIVIHDSVELAAFYRSVDVLVVPSHYEGFGLPVLEAMQYGTPVVFSNTTSLPEVGGYVARYFDPDDAEHLADHIEQLSDPKARKELVEPSIRRAEEFSWRRHLVSLYTVYAGIQDERRAS